MSGKLRAAARRCYIALSLLTAFCVIGTGLLWRAGDYGRWGAEPGALYRAMEILLVPYDAVTLPLLFSGFFWLLPPLLAGLAVRSWVRGRKLRQTDRRAARRCLGLAAVHLLNAAVLCRTGVQALLSI